MSILEGLLIFFIILFAYFVIVIFLHKKGILEKYNLSLYGPTVMVRTKKGIKFLERIARNKRFWKAYGSSGIVLCIILMFFMLAFFVYNVWILFGLTPEQQADLPGIEFALALPGINPVLPMEFFIYIIIAFVVAIIVHEFSHGILTIAANLKVKSMGLLYMIIPLGAFCEPDEEQVKKTNPIKRMRIYSAGPTSNFTIAFICLLLFSFVLIPVLQPAADGANILTISENSPAEDIGLSPGSIITSINDTEVSNPLEFFYISENLSANSTVNISFVKSNNIFTKKVTLADKYYYSRNESDKGKAFLGVGLDAYSFYKGSIRVMKKPFDNLDNFAFIFFLPFIGYFQGYNPIAAPFTDSFVVTGPLSFLPNNLYWGIVNTIYWIFWLNLAVGLFNVLPMVPLDGGFIFSDSLGLLVKKIKKGITEEQKDKIVRKVTLGMSLLILAIILLPFLIKYI